MEKGIEKFSGFQGIVLVGHPGLWFHASELRTLLREASIPVVCADFELEEGKLDADYIVNDFESVVQKAENVLKEIGIGNWLYRNVWDSNFYGSLKARQALSVYRRKDVRAKRSVPGRVCLADKQ